MRRTLTPAIAHAVAQTWGCDLGRAIPLGGSTGLILLAGIGDRRVVVRVHRGHVTVARVEALQLAREIAATANVPTAAAITGRRGERSIAVDSCVIEVEEFVPSDAKMDALPRIEAAMPMLGRLHDALEAADLPDEADQVVFANYLSAHEVARRTAVGSARIRTLNEELRTPADAADALADELAGRTRAFEALRLQWCHGDFWDDNVLFRGDEIALVADFGFMGRRPRVDDLALTLYFTLWDLVTAGHDDCLRTLAALVDGYDKGTRRPLSDVERDALPLSIARQPLWSVGVWAAELDDPKTVVAHLRGHDAALMIARHIIDDVDRWREELRR